MTLKVDIQTGLHITVWFLRALFKFDICALIRRIMYFAKCIEMESIEDFSILNWQFFLFSDLNTRTRNMRQIRAYCLR